LGWRFLGLAHGSYALFETQAGLVLLDRRACLERIWFERLKRQAEHRTQREDRQRLTAEDVQRRDPAAGAGPGAAGRTACCASIRRR
jgi:DNA mismatch repair protein MutL